MIDRRRFIQYSGAVAAALSAPSLAGTADPKQLPTRPIPSTGEELPIVGLGNSAAFQDGAMALSRELVGILTDHGGSYVDTIGSARSTIAKIIAEDSMQDELFVGSYIGARSYATGRTEVDRLQKEQGGGPLDLLLTSDMNDLPRRWTFIDQYKKEGRACYIGIAKSGREHFDTIMRLMESHPVDFIQVNYSLLEPEAADRILPMAQEKGVAVVVNRPFLNGVYFQLVEDRELPDWAAEFDCESWAEFSLKFILAHPAVNCVLTETTDPDHARQNVRSGFGTLPDEDTRQRMLQVAKEIVS